MTIATTTAGDVRGAETLIEGVKVRSFLGIPYAGSTAGTGRFLTPVAAAGWAGVRDCSGPGPAAPQNREFPALLAANLGLGAKAAAST